ncbi:uncharacterized protein Z520_11506 [Fonsecaea multimorphosa CBS 102226]|uniref:Glucose-methanol-choline oxidoreductase N-terminal domain-containing protein n=1 Tax=Fonsecaea multimorphosa CBS 102226 TaxID=1442371 RepID=A0A0D2JI36_9EURO|nr:uncharacterized protein Z520_11506 [Fonsecaea multimorphosa CBS 102226]KIX92842.1 hypothetical protein Z520_11506 [Fonsecaea multimorphosa CBS 102226]OAL18090.1 hypothetical protein AYO22_11013 [Fonsecaea multimorphosa]
MSQTFAAGTRSSLTDVNEFMKHEYDFLIIGGGTAGLVLANRLSNDPRFTVGVLEAGADHLDDSVVDAPAMAIAMTGDENYDWHFVTCPQGPKGFQCHLPRGKMLGGSSGINWMVYTRPSRQDLDDWASLVGDPSWAAANMQKYLLRHQTLELLDDALTERTGIACLAENHGLDGPIHTSFNTLPLMPLEEAVYYAGIKASGLHAPLVDPWAGDHLGFYRSLGTVYRSGLNKGKRSYAARSYLEPVLDRPNLHVLCNAHVTKIQLHGNRAVGAEFDHRAKHYNVRAKREVLLCAGALSSPHLLQLSGIGNRELLERAGIECQVESPQVGENLQDHPAMVVSYELKRGVLSADVMKDEKIQHAALEEYRMHGTGPLASISSIQGFAPVLPWLNDDDIDEINQSVESQSGMSSFQKAQQQHVLQQIKNAQSAFIHVSPAPVTVDCDPEGGYADQSKVFVKTLPEGAPHGFGFAVGLQYTFARGWVHAVSNDPYAQPQINQNMLGHPADVVTASAALAFIQSLVDTPPLKDLIARRTYPREADYDLHKQEDRREHAKGVWASQYHLCGSCAMGEVVDTRLRFKGVDGLRVVDASIFPNHVSGNIQSSVYMVAEKAADMILEESPD